MSQKFDFSLEQKEKIQNNLNVAYDKAQKEFFADGHHLSDSLDENFREWLSFLSSKSEQASAAFTNVMTGLCIKSAFPELDVRYHQTQIQAESAIGKTWFNHRGISENIIYPWLHAHDFNGAKSGWQTRTLERPKPYTLSYDENIGRVKKEFLSTYDFIENSSIEQVKNGLAYLLLLQIRLRELRKIDLATPNIDIISTIVRHLSDHIHYSYSGKGASRLPVLCLYATLQIIQHETARYSKLHLNPLEEHSAADARTGAAGDIEFAGVDGQIIEAIEVKHNIQITESLILDVQSKISPFQLERYYILTTHLGCKPSQEMLIMLDTVKNKIGCQIIVNGVIPTIKYYLRLLQEPQKVYANYTTLLETDGAVTHEHREAWNHIVLNA